MTFGGLLANYKDPLSGQGDREVLAFGKHQGKRIKDLELSYLRWLDGNYTARTEPQRRFMELCMAELAQREEFLKGVRHGYNPATDKDD